MAFVNSCAFALWISSRGINKSVYWRGNVLRSKVQAHRACQLGQTKGHLVWHPISARAQQRVFERSKGWSCLCSVLPSSPSWLLASNGWMWNAALLCEAACAHLERPCANSLLQKGCKIENGLWSEKRSLNRSEVFLGNRKLAWFWIEVFVGGCVSAHWACEGLGCCFPAWCICLEECFLKGKQ